MSLPTEQQTAVNLAIMGTKMTHMEAGMTDMKFASVRQSEKIEEILKGMNDINQQLAEAKGGYKALLLMGGVAGSLGGLVTWLVTNFKG